MHLNRDDLALRAASPQTSEALIGIGTARSDLLAGAVTVFRRRQHLSALFREVRTGQLLCPASGKEACPGGGRKTRALLFFQRSLTPLCPVDRIDVAAPIGGLAARRTKPFCLSEGFVSGIALRSISRLGLIEACVSEKHPGLSPARVLQSALFQCSFQGAFGLLVLFVCQKRLTQPERQK